MEDKDKILKEIEGAKDLESLNQIYKKYLGKKGEISLVFRNLKDLTSENRIKVAKKANDLKRAAEDAIKLKEKKLKKDGVRKEEKKIEVDVTLPGKKIETGHLHPLTIIRREVERIFESMGFYIAEGPDVETEWYNFDALNIPKEHPARDQWDTFWLKTDEKLLLRTHTSPVQIRYMENHKPPLRIIAPGNVFRHEATDASHEFQLIQIEGLMVDKNISVPNFKAVVEEFFRRFFDKKVTIRLRPDFFPFTEPSFDISMSCLVCGGKGCPACKQSGWIEVAGAGMVHPHVLKSGNIDPEKWQGWAFGFGLERLTMMKYKINNIRLFRGGDLRFLKQF
jgi:phenylalanyl-tRNA synthetase alpha chain